VSYNAGGFGSSNCRCVSDNLVVNNHRRHKNFVHYLRTRPDWDVRRSHSEAIDVISYVTSGLNDAISIHVGVFAAGYTVQGLGFDLGRGTPGISVTVLAQVILYVVLVTGGRYYNRIWHCRYLLHVQHSSYRNILSCDGIGHSHRRCHQAY